MSLKDFYESKEALALDIINKHELPKGVSFSGIDQYNRIVFDFSIDLKGIDVSVMSEIVGKTNFVDRYYQQNVHRVKG